MKLIQQLKQITDLSHACEEEIKQRAKKQVVERGEIIHAAGEVCKKLFFIDSGLLRFFYYDAEGKEVTYHFFEENHFTSIINSYYHKAPSFYNIQSLENSTLYVLYFSEFEEMLERFPELESVYSYVLREFLMVAEHRILAFQFYSAEERYQDLLQNQPSIIQRAPLGHVASFLGISQATLSRVRSRTKI